MLSSVTTALALLVKCISTELSFRRIGIAICQRLITEDNIQILGKCLSANRHQDQLLSATLRLLTEIVSYDGGVCAKSVYRQKAVLFRRLDELLGARVGAEEGKKGPQTSSLRLNAVKFLLANLRVQEPATKGDILSDPKRIRALFQIINEDSSSTIATILQTVEEHVLGDAAVSRQTKGRLLTESTLTRIASLYNVDDEQAQEIQLSALVQRFLIKACCTPGAGVLLKSDGWYNPRPQKDAPEFQIASGPRFTARTSDKGVHDGPLMIANHKLSNFLQELRPHGNVQHRELTLAVFQAAPELVADYFIRRKNFSFDPKLTSTWVGFTSLVLATMQLPIPAFQVSKGLPKASTVLENVLPSSLTKKSLTRCFNQSSLLIRLMASKVVASASRKLKEILHAVEQEAAALSSFEAWKSSVLSGFTERCPEIQSIVLAFRACSEEHALLRESLLDAIAAISAVQPQAMLSANFDVSVLLTDALGEAASDFPDIRQLDVDHLLQAADCTELDWFRKPERLQLSPFVTVLRIWVNEGGRQFQSLLGPVLYDNFALLKSDAGSALEALKLSIQQSQLTDSFWEFLDNCLLRFTQRPIKYEAELKKLQSADETARISLLTMVVVEQWPHFVQAHSAAEVTATATWIARWLHASSKVGENEATLRGIEKMLVLSTPEYAAKEAAAVNPVSFPDDDISASKADRSANNSSVQERDNKLAQLSDTYNNRLALPTHSDSYPELHRHSKRDILDLIEEGDLSALLWCLSAEELNIRRQALSQLRSLALRIEQSDYSEKAQLYLLLMEVVETATQLDLLTPLPSIVATLASKVATVLHDPAHFMYPKINRFLLKAPEWSLGKLPSYWISRIFYSAPTNDDKYSAEADWLFDLLRDGLRSKTDLDLYRRCRVFEHVMAKDLNQSSQTRGKVVDLLWRCTMIEGGSQTLVTRFAALSWLNGKRDDERYEALAKRIVATCDAEKLKVWSEGRADILESKERAKE